MGAQMLVISGAGLIMVGLVNREGLVTAAAYGATLQLWNYIQMPALAVGAAVSSMAAQNIGAGRWDRVASVRSEEHTSELQSLMRISYAVFCLKKKKCQSNVYDYNLESKHTSGLTTHTIILMSII